uniref:Prenylcysteine oxidase 1 like n=1 Tax=Sus scrofa TaxID=9823 RepID=F1RL93_PIG
GGQPSLGAVVGAGVGGSAVAHFLQQHFGPRVQIDVFEKGTVGGRLATISVNKQHYESGAASLHSLSLHMQDFVKQLGLRHRREVGGRSAIFNGESLVLEETDWYLLNLFRLWWHYGISFLRLQLWVEEVMEKFMRIYKYQAHGYAFSGVEELLYSLGEAAFINMSRRSVAESLLRVGVSQRFIDDVVSAVLRASYGQSAAMPAFAGAMSLAGAQGSLWSVEGGNKLVCSGLLKLTKANVIHATVTSVTLQQTDGKPLYQVWYENEAGVGSDYYDIVVIATPLHPDSGSSITFGASTRPSPSPKALSSPPWSPWSTATSTPPTSASPTPSSSPSPPSSPPTSPASSWPWTTSAPSTSRPASGAGSRRRPPCGGSGPHSPSSGPSSRPSSAPTTRSRRPSGRPTPSTAPTARSRASCCTTSSSTSTPWSGRPAPWR